MLAPNRSLFNREQALINVLKALASIISVCNLHVIVLSKITPRNIDDSRRDVTSFNVG
jgi:hypothetical protein